MGLGNCPECWEDTCECGYMYRSWSEQRIKDFIAVLLTIIKEKREEGIKELVAQGEEDIQAGRVRSHGEVFNDIEQPLTGTKCSVCGEPQFKTRGGDCCKNGHGGAPPLVDR